jgi:hypothetical protein
MNIPNQENAAITDFRIQVARATCSLSLPTNGNNLSTPPGNRRSLHVESISREAYSDQLHHGISPPHFITADSTCLSQSSDVYPSFQPLQNLGFDAEQSNSSPSLVQLYSAYIRSQQQPEPFNQQLASITPMQYEPALDHNRQVQITSRPTLDSSNYTDARVSVFNNYVLRQQQQLLIHQQQFPSFSTTGYGELDNFRGRIIDQGSDNLLASAPSQSESYDNSDYNSGVFHARNWDSPDL